MRYFVTAIGTDSGKTLVSAILLTALKAHYWKPIQAGFPTDTHTIRTWLPNQEINFHKEAYALKMAASPHAAAGAENIKITLKDITLPDTAARPLVIEGAGGLMVPLNDREFMIDLAMYVDAEIILVADLYLGSINHTLLSVDLLKSRGCKVKGIVFNGPENKTSQEFILNYAQFPLLLHIRPEKEINTQVINRYALELLKEWNR